METKQPIWKKLQSVGDINPLDYSGGFIYVDETGVYDPEIEWVNANGSEKGIWFVYRWPLERFETLRVGERTALIPYGFGERTDLPFPVDSYEEWFSKDIPFIANYVGTSEEAQQRMLCSEDPVTRALGYLNMADYFGYNEFDGYPLVFTDREELEKRYK